MLVLSLKAFATKRMYAKTLRVFFFRIDSGPAGVERRGVA